MARKNVSWIGSVVEKLQDWMLCRTVLSTEVNVPEWIADCGGGKEEWSQYPTPCTYYTLSLQLDYLPLKFPICIFFRRKLQQIQIKKARNLADSQESWKGQEVMLKSKKPALQSLPAHMTTSCRLPVKLATLCQLTYC